MAWAAPFPNWEYPFEVLKKNADKYFQDQGPIMPVSIVRSGSEQYEVKKSLVKYLFLSLGILKKNIFLNAQQEYLNYFKGMSEFVI